MSQLATPRLHLTHTLGPPQGLLGWGSRGVPLPEAVGGGALQGGRGKKRLQVEGVAHSKALRRERAATQDEAGAGGLGPEPGAKSRGNPDWAIVEPGTPGPGRHVLRALRPTGISGPTPSTCQMSPASNLVFGVCPGSGVRGQGSQPRVLATRAGSGSGYSGLNRLHLQGGLPGGVRGLGGPQATPSHLPPRGLAFRGGSG